jgi:FlaG/FlaF family flagellin (archaellin)
MGEIIMDEDQNKAKVTNNALHVTLTDSSGDHITTSNPLAVSDPIKAENITITVSGGTGSGTSTTTFSNLLWFVVSPTTASTTYDLTVTENTTNYNLLSATGLTGTQQISSLFPCYNNKITISITNSSANENFTIQVRYR